jgi:hypothetical protein
MQPGAVWARKATPPGCFGNGSHSSQIQDYLKERLEEAQAADGSEAAAGAAWPGCAARASSDGAAALRLLQPELRVPLADLPQAVRAAVQAGRIKGSLVGDARAAPVLSCALPAAAQRPAVPCNSHLLRLVVRSLRLVVRVWYRRCACGTLLLR